MEFAAAKDVFESLYTGIAGYEVSHSQRKRDNLEDRSLIYGEVLPAGFHQLLTQANPPAGGVFYDLGSGSGKAIVLAALLGSFSRLVGVEILSDLVETSRSVLARFDAEVRPTLPPEQQAQKIEFLSTDLLSIDFSDADLVFTHSTCFESNLLKAMGEKLGELKKGAKVIGIGRTIPSAHLNKLQTTMIELDWGSTGGVLYERI